jgi:DnaJ-domain-containing protein 1
MQQMEWEEHLEDIEKNNSELAQFKLTINKKYEEYFLLISTQIDHDQNWSDAAISIDKLYFIEKLLQKINNALN